MLMVIRGQWKYKISLNEFEKPVGLGRQSFPNYCGRKFLMKNNHIRYCMIDFFFVENVSNKTSQLPV